MVSHFREQIKDFCLTCVSPVVTYLSHVCLLDVNFFVDRREFDVGVLLYSVTFSSRVLKKKRIFPFEWRKWRNFTLNQYGITTSKWTSLLFKQIVSSEDYKASCEPHFSFFFYWLMPSQPFANGPEVRNYPKNIFCTANDLNHGPFWSGPIKTTSFGWTPIWSVCVHYDPFIPVNLVRNKK